MQGLLIVLLLTVAAAAQAEMPSFSGTWRLDRDLTTADLRWNKITILTVSQSDGDVRFDSFDRDRLLGSETFVTDGEERPRYSTRLARAYSRARWDKNELVVTTRVFLDVYGYQSYNEADRWDISDDGKTLTDKSSDGKVMVYYRLDAEPGSSP